MSALHLQNICRTFAKHLQIICRTFATRLQNICDTFAWEPHIVTTADPLQTLCATRDVTFGPLCTCSITLYNVNYEMITGCVLKLTSDEYRYVVHSESANVGSYAVPESSTLPVYRSNFIGNWVKSIWCSRLLDRATYLRVSPFSIGLYRLIFIASHKQFCIHIGFNSKGFMTSDKTG
jgi:hypothetical protein